jgi:hypothetical protein
MSKPTLEERVTELERLVAQLLARPESNGLGAPKDWRSTIGMFADDPIWEQIVEEGRKIREADRKRAALRGTGRKRTKNPKTDRKRRSA